MGKGLALVGVGTAIGLVMGFAVERLMNSLVFDAGSVDMVAYVIVVPSLLLFTMLAVYIPARRASKIPPIPSPALRVVSLKSRASFLFHAKQALTAEDIRAQEFVSEFALRVILLAELNEVGQLLVNRFQLRWGGGKQFSPMRPSLEWS